MNMIPFLIALREADTRLEMLAKFAKFGFAEDFQRFVKLT